MFNYSRYERAFDVRLVLSGTVSFNLAVKAKLCSFRKQSGILRFEIKLCGKNFLLIHDFALIKNNHMSNDVYVHA